MNKQILNISRRVGLIDLFKEKGFKIGVEVGTDRGGYAKDICERMPGVKLYTIDPYLPFIEGDQVNDEKEMYSRYVEAMKTLAPYKNCQIINKTSMEAVKEFEPNSIDFVFIDGDHRADYVLEDIREWTKIVKPGGIVAGHDFVNEPKRNYGVIQAVNYYVQHNNIEPLYILRKGSFVDCWMFIKQ